VDACQYPQGRKIIEKDPIPHQESNIREIIQASLEPTSIATQLTAWSYLRICPSYQLETCTVPCADKRNVIVRECTARLSVDGIISLSRSLVGSNHEASMPYALVVVA